MWSLDDNMLAAWTRQWQGQQQQQQQLQQQDSLVQQHPQRAPEPQRPQHVGVHTDDQATQGKETEQELACVAARLRHLGLLLSGCM